MTKETNEKIQTIMDTLQDWKGSELEIEKKELGDVDKNTIALEDVEIVKQPHDEEDYVDPYTIELKGKGTIITRNGSAQKLPLNSYELPINQLLAIEASKDLLTIKTDRATYLIKK